MAIHANERAGRKTSGVSPLDEMVSLPLTKKQKAFLEEESEVSVASYIRVVLIRHAGMPKN